MSECGGNLGEDDVVRMGCGDGGRSRGDSMLSRMVHPLGSRPLHQINTLSLRESLAQMRKEAIAKRRRA